MQWFKLFLCARWGKTLAEIDALSSSEFIQHKLFWERFKWGLQDDLLAIVASQITAHRTGKVPQGELSGWKDLALYQCGVAIKKVGTTANSQIRKGFEMLARVIGVKK